MHYKGKQFAGIIAVGGQLFNYIENTHAEVYENFIFTLFIYNFEKF